MSDRACTVYMVRHGERIDETKAGALWRKQNKARWFDPPLTLEGQKQANHAARGLYALCMKTGVVPFNKVYCSPLLRCLMSAEQFGIVFNLPIVPVPGIASCTAAYKRHGRKQSYLSHQDAIKYVPACFVEPFQQDHYQEYHQAIVRLALSNQHLLIVTHREGLRDTSILCKQPFQTTPYCCTAVFTHCLVEKPARCFRRPQAESSWTILASPGAFQKTVDQVHPRRLVEDKYAAGEEITSLVHSRAHHIPSATPAVHRRNSSDSSNQFTTHPDARISSSHQRSSWNSSTIVPRDRPAHSIYSLAEPPTERRRLSYTREDVSSVPDPRLSHRTTFGDARHHFRSITEIRGSIPLDVKSSIFVIEQEDSAISRDHELSR